MVVTVVSHIFIFLERTGSLLRILKSSLGLLLLLLIRRSHLSSKVYRFLTLVFFLRGKIDAKMLGSSLNGSRREVDIRQVLNLSSVLVGPHNRFSQFFPFSLTTSIVFKFHVQIEGAFRTVELFAFGVWTFVRFLYFVSASSEMLLPATHVSFNLLIGMELHLLVLG